MCEQLHSCPTPLKPGETLGQHHQGESRRPRRVTVQVCLTWQSWPHVGHIEAMVRKEARDVVYVFYLRDKGINSALSRAVCLCFLCRTTPSIPAPAFPAR